MNKEELKTTLNLGKITYVGCVNYRGETVLIREHLCEGKKVESALCENSLCQR